MFFGVGWALTSLVALNYLQSMIFPQTVVSWTYFLTTFIGHYGVILSLVYFLIYCPVVLIFPSYYISKIWSSLLIVSLNLLLFFDSYLFIRYRFHLNSFLWNFLSDQEALRNFGLTTFKLIIIGFITFIAFYILWFRGEKIWRNMQGHFRNPVKNWYLFLIFICFITSQLMHMYGDAKGARYITRLSVLFPLNSPLVDKVVLEQNGLVGSPITEKHKKYKDLFYPAKSLDCSMKQSKNILMIVLDKLSENELNNDLLPYIYHLTSHGLLFENHYSGGLNKDDGYFSLLYSLPPTYSESVINQSAEPVVLAQFKKAKFDASFFQTGGKSPLTKFLPNEKEIMADYIESTLVERNELSKTDPFFMNVFLGSGTLTEKDIQVKIIIDLFTKHKQINNTIVILTAAFSDEIKTPLIMIRPDIRPDRISKLTSHYDVLPSIMIEDWKCKNVASEIGFGKNIFSPQKSEIHVAGNKQNLKILDFKAQAVTTIDYQQRMEVKKLGSTTSLDNKGDMVSILNVLQKLTSFYKQ